MINKIELQESEKHQQYDTLLIVVTLISIFLLPRIPLGEGLPAFRIEDILLIPIGIKAIQQKKWNSTYSKIIGVFGAYILFTIIYNNRTGNIRDYFEIFKLAKYLVFILYFSKSSNFNTIRRMLSPIFICLILFNVVHFYNFLSFNTLIEPFFAPLHHLQYFGVNSNFEPYTKRLLGTMGNPNNNGLLFLLFAIYFMPLHNKKSKSQLLLYFLAILLCLHSQSRTVFVALTLVCILQIAVNLTYVKRNILAYILFAAVLMFDFYADNLLYIESIFNTRISGFQTNNTSLQSRFEIWKHLISMIQQKPIFGHGPYKEYFYNRDLYSENEYILMAWRYGLLGLSFYITLVTYPIISMFKTLPVLDKIKLTSFTLSILFVALTNNPLSEPRILLMFALIVGTYFYINQRKQQDFS